MCRNGLILGVKSLGELGPRSGAGTCALLEELACAMWALRLLFRDFYLNMNPKIAHNYLKSIL